MNKNVCEYEFKLNVFTCILSIPTDRPHRILRLLGKRLWDLQQEDVRLLPSRYLIIFGAHFALFAILQFQRRVNLLIYINTDVNLAMKGG